MTQRCTPTQVGLAADVAALIREHAAEPPSTSQAIFVGHADEAPTHFAIGTTYVVSFTAFNNALPMVGHYATWEGAASRVDQCRRLGQRVQKIEAVTLTSTTRAIPVPLDAAAEARS